MRLCGEAPLMATNSIRLGSSRQGSSLAACMTPIDGDPWTPSQWPCLFSLFFHLSLPWRPVSHSAFGEALDGAKPPFLAAWDAERMRRSRILYRSRVRFGGGGGRRKQRRGSRAISVWFVTAGKKGLARRPHASVGPARRCDSPWTHALVGPRQAMESWAGSREGKVGRGEWLGRPGGFSFAIFFEFQSQIPNLFQIQFDLGFNFQVECTTNKTPSMNATIIFYLFILSL
jgi:hypothetical protein